jgi:hypothetical protein
MVLSLGTELYKRFINLAMAFIEQFVSDTVEEPGDIQSLQAQISKLGFDPIKELPKTFSVYQITEGFDIYDELRQSLHLEVVFDNKKTLLTLVFRAVRDEQEIEFSLIDIEARLYAINPGKTDKIAERYFGKKHGFPTKDRIVQEIFDEARRQAKIEVIRQQFRSSPNVMLNTSNMRMKH